MVRRYPDLFENARRYLTGKGQYPYKCRVRTPTGVVTPELFSSHDMSTVNEIFCREDYRAPASLTVAVDLGANIGISGLYFLTRNKTSRVYLFEPDPKNVARLRDNLAGYESRYRLEEVAVAARDGEATFGVESTGRYGTLRLEEPTGHPATRHITVRTRAITSFSQTYSAARGTLTSSRSTSRDWSGRWSQASSLNCSTESTRSTTRPTNLRHFTATAIASTSPTRSTA